MSAELESRNRIAKLIAAANAKTGNADADLTAAVGSLMAGYGVGDGSESAVELIYETEFNLEEKPTSKTDAYFTTGLTSDDMSAGDNILCVIKCENDTDEDTSYNHFKAQSSTIYVVNNSGAVPTNMSHCIWHDNGYNISSGASNFMFKNISSYFRDFQLTTRCDYAGYGVPAPGDYSLKLYKVSGRDLGLEGFV